MSVFAHQRQMFTQRSQPGPATNLPQIQYQANMFGPDHQIVDFLIESVVVATGDVAGNPEAQGTGR